MTSKKPWLGLGLVLTAVTAATIWFMLARQPQDIAGWQNLAWGQTQAQVAKLRKLEPWTESAAKPVCALGEPVELVGEKFRVYLYFSQKAPEGKLRAVTMMAQGHIESFAKLLDQLKAVYGQPSGQDDTFAFKSWQWSRPSGRLELMIVQAPDDLGLGDPLGENPRPAQAEDDAASCSLRYFAAD